MMMSAYPSGSVEVLDVEYLDPLILTRKITAVQRRKGEDARYVVARQYRACVTIKDAQGNHSTFMVHVLAGFLTNLSSVPRCFRWYIGRVGPHLEATILHDWLCTAWQLHAPSVPSKANRNFADGVFRVAMREANVGCFKRSLMHWVVSKFGRCSFERKVDRVFA